MTKVDLINKALTQLGAAPIVSITDNTANARAVNRVYEISLKAILNESKWNFATKRRLLSLSADTLEWYDSNSTYIYTKPSDAIFIYETNDIYADWRVEGDYIISDTSGLGVRYVYYNEDVAKFPAPFTQAFIDLLSSDIAFYILNSKPKAESMLSKYMTVSLPKAKSKNAQIGQQQQVRDDAWELAKYSDGQLNA